ncbi:dTDP-4-amino-4,6-dideoxygalactose transaminase [Desulfonatronum thiosulfatophilum]|uniref:dTDP-4-amino-4,6-dideoxygalactose transaminase n=1 Tax=Desulfonatronum thiosulfatophilum TaxID=617002 RepID=A0A1G6C0K5_9BACT|nr:DegT/DnrJ/EryC1/StrS family aminotransferase [Desulfonatronum thiosulfatophilum]SDB26390.1 dTDP-4-amino-4,6-dideoxygalactose transaminase [Desulfonatronum thiosulfatophilum]
MAEYGQNFLVFGSPFIGEEEVAEVAHCIRTGWLGTGPKVARFEREFAAYKDIPPERAAAVNSCTAALHVSMIAAGLQPGDEVITTPLTFCATVNAIIHAGATPVLADVNPVTMNIDPAMIEDRITSRTRAVIPVHFAGRPCDMDAICAIAEKHSLKIIEDCAHAIETEYRGQKAGTMGDFGCFSFYVTKNIVTGEGGMVLARNEAEVSRVKMLALHGMTKDAWHRFGDEGHKHYFVAECGFKYNMMDIQAAIGIHQLARVESNWLRRREIWKQYQLAFADLPVIRPAPDQAETRHGHHLYTLLIDESRSGISRDAFLDAMTAAEIGVGVHYLSIPEHPYYQNRFGWKPEQWPHAMRIGRQTVSLPLSAKLTDSDVERVVSVVREILSLH